MSVSQAETIRTLSDTVTRLERENEVLQRFNDSLLQQVQDLQFQLHSATKQTDEPSLLEQIEELKFQLNSVNNLFDKLTLLEEPPRGDDDTTLFDIKPASGE